jgi:hypothetical protein
MLGRTAMVDRKARLQKKRDTRGGGIGCRVFRFCRNLFCLSANLGGNTAPCIGPSAFRLLSAAPN